METQSEKALYRDAVEYALAGVDADFIIWGEELFDTKIVLYPKKIKSIPGYEKIKDKLINVALVYFDFAKEHYIKSSVVRCDFDNEILYIPEGNFNAIWRFLRKSVELGMRIQREEGKEVAIDVPEEIVDLSLLQRKGSEAIIKKGQLSYIARELPEEYVKAQGRKQSALDNQKNKYFYAVSGDVYHDRDCELIKKIEPEDFMFSEDKPEGLRACKKCRRRLYLREACSPYVKIIPDVDEILTEGGLQDYHLEKYVFDYKLKFRMDKDGSLIVEGNEDTWIIKGYGQSHFSLWHNNYVRTGDHERYITHGFHEQGVNSKRLFKLMDYIHNYTFDKHLAAEERAEKERLESIRAEEKKQRFENSWIGRLVTFVQGLFQHR